MAETVGRVDFLASLDGRNLPRQTKQLAREIGLAGDEAGDAFGDNFESSFRRRLTDFGDGLSDDLERKGRLAGERFGNTLDGTLRSRFQRMQNNLADILTDEESFRRFAASFDSVGEAVDRASDDLEELRQSSIRYKDETGRVRRQSVLTEEQFHSATLQLRELGDITQEQVDRDARLAETQRRLAQETDELNAKWARLTRLVGDKDSFMQAAERVGGIENAHRRLRTEIEQGGTALGRTRTEIDTYVDRLDLTRDRALRVAAAVREAEREHDSFGRTVRNLGNIVSKPWQSLDNDVRLVVGLIAAAADQVAALGSAAGAGLVSVGGTIGALGVGLSGVIPVFLALNRESAELPPHLREVAAEFDLLKRGFSGAASTISSAAFAELPGTFSSLRESLSGLSPEFTTLGSTVGRLGRDLAKSLKPGTEGFDDMQRFVRSSIPLFDSLARSAGTLGGALVRGFDRAVPLTQDFVGWIDKLATRFDDFTRSSAFDDWILNAQAIWGDFGELLDATGEALGDLANPSSVANLRALMDDLTTFMPQLATGLNVIGELNVLGLVAEALTEIGTALSPLADPLYDLMGALSDVASIFIGEFADALGVAATLIAPLVQAGADFIDALPPGTIELIANSVMGLGGAFLLLKGYSGIGAALGAMDSFSTAGAAMVGTADNMKGKLSGLVGKAGIFALIGTGALLAVDGINSLADALAAEILPSLSETSAALQDATTGAEVFSVAFKAQGMAGDLEVVKDQLGNVSYALQEAADNSANFFDPIANDAQGTLTLIQGMGDSFGELAKVDLDAAVQQFVLFADAAKLSKEQQGELLNQMGPFKEELEKVAQGQGELLTATELAAFAQERAAEATRDGAGAFEGFGLLAEGAGIGVGILNENLQQFVEDNFAARSAARDYEQAIDDLTESIAENGNVLDIGEQAGRRNESALDALALKTLAYADETRKNTGSQAEANAVIDAGREKLIEQLAAFNITGAEADAYADKLGLITPEVSTDILTPGLDAAKQGVDVLSGKYDAVDPTVSTQFNTPGLLSAQSGADRLDEKIRRVPTSWNTNFTVSGAIANAFSIPKTAVGGTFFGSQIREIAEDGPEAVVPLNRPLSQVDPSVRELSAFAQGLLPAPAAQGGGKRIIIEAGAIVVQGADDPRATAIEVANELAELVGS